MGKSLEVFDPLYGRFDVPTYLGDLVNTPEVRRLSQVRLLNTMTPSLATLGEIRRYSHTLGVLYLSLQNCTSGFTAAERRAFQASVLLHDIGTPPFGHLVEYQLREGFRGWHHEAMIRPTLWGCHVPENTAHQIFSGRSIAFRPTLERNQISLELVERIIQGKHPLSVLLFGSLDLDNLDNVSRMSWALGLQSGAELSVALASQMTTDADGKLILAKTPGESLVSEWLQLRKKVYEIIVFDAPTVAAQAVLSKAVKDAFKCGFLSQSDWALSDEDLLTLLRSRHETKDLIIRDYLGRLPVQVFGIQIAGDLALSNSEEARDSLEAALRTVFPRERCFGYIFVDSGAFQKRLEFYDPSLRTQWSIGSDSRSAVFYGFVSTTRSISVSRSRSARDLFLSKIGVPTATVIRELFGNEKEEQGSAQRSFDFSPA